MAQDEKIKVTIDSDLEDLIPGYIENRHKDIASLEAALAQGDLEVAKVLGHRMKGSGAGYGFDQITEIGRAMELAAKNQDLAEVRHQLEALRDYMQRVEVVFN
ncbi:MAG: Hpt domain-containing protein [Magnetococcales bacterium]|nr:Hpt domain-containing protein [Magnetococcales bacterium]NGZ26429.1 Hpt domain-containing protein [Magnetococcales bacterium]